MKHFYKYIIFSLIILLLLSGFVTPAAPVLAIVAKVAAASAKAAKVAASTAKAGIKITASGLRKGVVSSTKMMAKQTVKYSRALSTALKNVRN
jgi:hypothetical protein